MQMLTNSIDLTIILLTYNRNYVINKQVEYILKFDFTLIVLDGSNCPNLYLTELSKTETSLTYIWDKFGFGARFKSAVNFINSSYVLTFTDDDFICIDSLSTVVEKMKADKVEFAFGNTLLAYPLRKTWGLNKWSPPFVSQTNRSISDSNALRRTEMHFENYVTTYYYSITSKENWISTYGNIQLEPDHFSSPYIHELYIEYIAAATGSAKIYPEVTAIRIKDHIPILVNAHLDYRNNLKVCDWLIDPKFEAEKQHLIQSLNEIMLKKFPELTINSITENILKCLELYAKRESQWSQGNLDIFASLFKEILNRFSLFIKIVLSNSEIIETFLLKHKAINLIKSNKYSMSARDLDSFLNYLSERNK
jgi:glycosyltransferase domain-containing protein